MADEERQRPRPHPFRRAAFVCAEGGQVLLPIRGEAAAGKRAALGYPQAYLLREVLALDANGVADDPVAVAPATTWSFAHLAGEPLPHAVEEAPTPAGVLEFAFELGVGHPLAF